MATSIEGESDRLEGAPHPRHTSGLIGHPDQERVLLDAYRRGRLPHAIILGGPVGIGKATMAWRLARFILAHPRSNEPAVQDAADLGVASDSRAAAQVASLSHPDLVLLRRAYNDRSKRFFTEIRAEEVRRAIGLFQRAAGAGGYRVCIVDSAEDLNRHSANALLKIIEEPPPRSLFLLIAHRPGLVLATIRSRSRLVRLDPLSPAQLAQVVASLGPPWCEMDDQTIAAATQRSEGSVREALRLLGGSGIELDGRVVRLLDRLPAVDWGEVHKLADAVGGRDGEAAYETALTTVFGWLDAQVRRQVGAPPRRLAPYAEVWEKVAQSARETDALNLDKRPLILSIFSDLAAAVRASSA